MKITSIECLHLRLPYQDRIRTRFHHFSMIEEHTVYRFHTDSEWGGLGESVGPPFDEEVLAPYIGTDPVEHLMGSGRFNLDMACYDLVGKQLGQPAWKLMGPQMRQWVSMGWWMPCMSPEDSAAEVEEAVSRGYRGLKCKARAFYDVVETAQAMQQRAAGKPAHTDALRPTAHSDPTTLGVEHLTQQLLLLDPRSAGVVDAAELRRCLRRAGLGKDTVDAVLREPVCKRDRDGRVSYTALVRQLL